MNSMVKSTSLVSWAIALVKMQLKYFRLNVVESSFLPANCGGLLGLFCGFSLISLVEIIYFLTFRLWAACFSRYKAKQLRNANQARKPCPESTEAITESSIEEPRERRAGLQPHASQCTQVQVNEANFESNM